MSNYEIVDETRLKDLDKSGFDYVRISFPNSNYDPIFVAFKERPTEETFKNLVANLYNNDIDNYIVTNRKKIISEVSQ